MGNVWTRFFDLFSSKNFKKEVRILMVGLDNAGKTTILHSMRSRSHIETVPTIGFNVETLKYKNLQMQIWDLGGQDKFRKLWRCYFCQTDAIIFVLDSADETRMDMAHEEMHKLLAESDENDKPVLLVLANKRDLPDTLSDETIMEKMELSTLLTHKWTVRGCSAKNGTGIPEAFNWVHQTLLDKVNAGKLAPKIS
mmetsp:Transcript_13991/g.15442  ORF Transcript_13991/g.15442 Transcript_13991/m.15442 type:complete len:196 (-) Transcript_13991:412-999(-)